MMSKELDTTQRAAIDQIKAWVNKCIHTRDELACWKGDIQPSPYWQFFARGSSYLRAMPSEQFASLRLHTYHLDGDTYQSTFFSSPARYRARYRALTRDLPERFRLSAPRACGEYGHDIDGSLVNEAVLRWQELIGALFRCKLLQRLVPLERPVILDIGGGYGALAYHLHGIFESALYIIVDIPETLLYSASYLTLIYGADRVALWAEPSAHPPDRITNAAFLCVPNYCLNSLSNLWFDLSLNIESFQEMTASQITDYAEFLRSRTHWLVSDNRDRQEKNPGQVCVSKLLRQRFDLQPLPRDGILGSTAGHLKRLLRGFSSGYRWPPLKRYVAIPKTAQTT
jgi:putative sugar O-methyltransferase